MDPVLIAGIVLGPSVVVFLGGCAIAGYRTLRDLPLLARPRQVSRQTRF